MNFYNLDHELFLFLICLILVGQLCYGWAANFHLASLLSWFFYSSPSSPGPATSEHRLITHFFASCLTPVPMDKIHILAKPQPSPLFWNRHWQEWDFTRQGRKRGTFQTKAQTQKAWWRWMPEERASGPVWVQLSNMSLYLRSASAELHTPTAH